MFAAATRGEESEQYPGGKPVRDAAIESGAARPAAELVADVRVTIYALEAAWASATTTTWSGFGIKSHSDGSRVPIPDLVQMRCTTRTSGSVTAGATGTPSSCGTTSTAG
jgi:maleylpyruvate isomerase